MTISWMSEYRIVLHICKYQNCTKWLNEKGLQLKTWKLKTNVYFSCQWFLKFSFSKVIFNTYKLLWMHIKINKWEIQYSIYKCWKWQCNDWYLFPDRFHVNTFQTLQWSWSSFSVVHVDSNQSINPSINQSTFLFRQTHGFT